MRLDSTNFFNEYMFHPFVNDLDTYSEKLLNLFFSTICFAALPVFIYCYFTAKPSENNLLDQRVHEIGMHYLDEIQDQQPLPSAPELEIEYNEFGLDGFEQPPKGFSRDLFRPVRVEGDIVENPDGSVTILEDPWNN